MKLDGRIRRMARRHGNIVVAVIRNNIKENVRYRRKERGWLMEEDDFFGMADPPFKVRRKPRPNLINNGRKA
jgi:hypothetical protein